MSKGAKFAALTLIGALALAAAGCASLNAPFETPLAGAGREVDEASWQDERLAEAAGRAAPSIVPQITLGETEAGSAFIGAMHALEARRRVQDNPRARRSEIPTDLNAQIEAARQRADPDAGRGAPDGPDTR